MASSNDDGGWASAPNKCIDSKCTRSSLSPALLSEKLSDDQLPSACQCLNRQFKQANHSKPRSSLTVGVYPGTFQTYNDLLDDDENGVNMTGSNLVEQTTRVLTPACDRKEPRNSPALKETFKNVEMDLSGNSGRTTSKPTFERAQTTTLVEGPTTSNNSKILGHGSDVDTVQYVSATKLSTAVMDQPLPDIQRVENFTSSLIQKPASDLLLDQRDSLLPHTQISSSDINPGLTTMGLDTYVPDRDLPDTQRTSLNGESGQYLVSLSLPGSRNAALPDTQASSTALEVYDYSSHSILGSEAPSGAFPTVDASERSTVALDFDLCMADTEVDFSFSTNCSLSVAQGSENIARTQFSGLNNEAESAGPSDFLQTEPPQPPITNFEDQTIQADPPKISVKERKRIAIPLSRPAKLTKAMQQWILKTNFLLDPFRENDDCWLHPSPPPARVAPNGTQRPVGKLQKSFTWQDRKGKHTIVLNYGIVSKLVYRKLTKQQKDGLINRRWHLSHLCGNWTCLNPAHTTVEPGSVNISRNNCFSHRSGCHHNPPCMKEKKVYLGADGKLFDLNSSTQVVSASGENNQDDWAAIFDDGDDFTIEDAEDAESVAASPEDGIDFFLSD